MIVLSLSTITLPLAWANCLWEIKLKTIIPRQNFEIPIQAAIGAKIIARTNIKAYRKDVTARIHTGDPDRRAKLLDKQKRGKKRMKAVGTVDVPQAAFMAVLKTDEEIK